MYRQLLLLISVAFHHVPELENWTNSVTVKPWVLATSVVCFLAVLVRNNHSKGWCVCFVLQQGYRPTRIIRVCSLLTTIPKACVDLGDSADWMMDYVPSLELLFFC